MDLPETKCPYARKQFDHEQAAEHETHNSQSRLRVRYSLANMTAITARMLAHIQTYQEIGKDAAHIERHKSEHGVMSIFGGKETLNLLARWVKVAVLGSRRPQQDTVESVVGNGGPPYPTTPPEKRLRITNAHRACQLTKKQPSNPRFVTRTWSRPCGKDTRFEMFRDVKTKGSSRLVFNHVSGRL
jgi:hypothetical protein